MIYTSDFKNGLNILVKNEAYCIIWFQNHKPGKGRAIMRVKLKHIKNGSIIERSFKSGDRFKTLNIYKVKKKFLYRSGSIFTFIDMVTFEQINVTSEFLGKKIFFIKEDLEVEAKYLETELISIELPIIIDFIIIETNGIRGDSVTNTTKLAKLETGFELRVPLFIQKGDRVKVNTKTNKYIERIT
ncbi:MAG: elongation factor P [Endomicrobium sp.]|jgi:elongation factor P|nr:elongation factor P [Endomicrobium sp.]